MPKNVQLDDDAWKDQWKTWQASGRIEERPAASPPRPPASASAVGSARVAPVTRPVPDAGGRPDRLLWFLLGWLWLVFGIANGVAIFALLGALLSATMGYPEGLVLVAYIAPAGAIAAVPGGLLAIVHVIRRGTVRVIEAIEASPEATAEAIRKAAKGKG